MNVRFVCPQCETPVRVDLPGRAEWQCPGCDHLGPAHACAGPGTLACCAACGNAELYRRKDFPHGLGLSILAVACVASVIPHWLYRPVWTWVILLGSVVIDGLLYLCVGDVVVCYRCDAHHRGFPANPEHRPFELTIQERYRQERIRRELAAAKNRERV